MQKSYKMTDEMLRVQKYLESYMELKQHIEVLDDLIQDLHFLKKRSIDLKVEYVEKIEEAYNVNIRSIQDQYTEEKLECIKKYVDVEMVIMRIPDKRQRDVLMYRYLLGTPVEMIPKKLNMSRATYFRLQSDALKYLAEGESDGWNV